MQTNDESLLFLADADAQRAQERARKHSQASSAGEPIELPSKPLAVLVRGQEAWIGENGFVARRVDLVSGQTRAVFRGHRGPVAALALHRPSSTGRLLLFTGSWDKSLRLWDAKTADLLGTVEAAHVDFIKCLVVLPSAGLLASGGSDRDVRLWDLSALENDTAPARIDPVSVAKGHTRPIECLASHAIAGTDETALWSADSMGRVCLWRIAPSSARDASSVSVDLACEWREHETAIYDLVVDADAGHVWTASADKTVLLCHFNPGRPERPPVPTKRLQHPYYVKAVLPYEDVVVTGSTDEGIRVWNASLVPTVVRGGHGLSTVRDAIGWNEFIATTATGASDHDDGRPPRRALINHIDIHSHEVNALVLWTRLTPHHDIEPWIVSSSLDGTLRRWKLTELLHPTPAVGAAPPRKQEGRTDQVGVTTAEEDAELEALMADE